MDHIRAQVATERRERASGRKVVADVDRPGEPRQLVGRKARVRASRRGIARISEHTVGDEQLMLACEILRKVEHRQRGAADDELRHDLQDARHLELPEPPARASDRQQRGGGQPAGDEPEQRIARDPW